MSAPTPDFALGYRSMMVDGLAREVEITKKVLAAVPEGKRDYRPDPHARTAWELAWHIANTDNQLLDGIADLKFTMANPPDSEKPKTIGTCGLVRQQYETRLGSRARHVGRTVVDAGPVFHLQLPGGILFGISEQSQHSSSRRVGDLSASDGGESAFNLWRKLRRAASGSRLRSRRNLKIRQISCIKSAALGGRLFLPSYAFGGLSSGPEPLHWVLLNHPIGRHEDHVFKISLGNKQSVKRIVMMIREPKNCQRMLV
ncbi:MAG: hypothetical protein WCD02_02645 [Terriglobales bacterium]